MENFEIKNQITFLKESGECNISGRDIEAFESKAGTLRLEGLIFAIQALIAVPGLSLEKAFAYSLNQLKVQ